MSEIMDRLVSLYLYKFIAICIGILALVFLFKVLYIRLTGKGSTGKNTNEKFQEVLNQVALYLRKRKKSQALFLGEKMASRLY